MLLSQVMTVTRHYWITVKTLQELGERTGTHLLLVDHAALRFSQDAFEVISGQTLQLNTDWEAALWTAWAATCVRDICPPSRFGFR